MKDLVISYEEFVNEELDGTEEIDTDASKGKFKELYNDGLNVVVTILDGKSAWWWANKYEKSKTGIPTWSIANDKTNKIGFVNMKKKGGEIKYVIIPRAKDDANKKIMIIFNRKKPTDPVQILDKAGKNIPYLKFKKILKKRGLDLENVFSDDDMKHIKATIKFDKSDKDSSDFLGKRSAEDIVMKGRKTE